MSMMLRRQMMMSGERLGEFTKAYTAIVPRTATYTLTVTHNLGIIPKIVLVEVASGTPTLESYTAECLYMPDVYGMMYTRTGYAEFIRNNGTGNHTYVNASSTITATESIVTLVTPSTSYAFDGGLLYSVSIYA